MTRVALHRSPACRSLQILGLLCLAVLQGCYGGKQPMVGLMTDLGWQDTGVAQIKGIILSANPKVEIVDLNHSLPSGNLNESAYLVDKTARYFPSGSIFLVLTDSMEKPILLETTQGRFYLGPDNGIFTQAMEREGVERVLDLTPEAGPADLPLREILATAAAQLAHGTKAKHLGKPLRQVTRLKLSQAARFGRKITGQVMQIDHDGHVISNITSKTFTENPTGHLIRAALDGKNVSIPLVRNFASGPDNRLFGFFNSEDELEFAYKGKPASDLMHLRSGATLSLTD